MFFKRGDSMTRVRKGDDELKFNLADSFMFRIAGVVDEVVLCGHIADLLKQAKDIFTLTSVSEETYALLDEAHKATEASFNGEFRGDL
ncbi:hypothetical protein GF391_04210, partial [Candidatus Uhrbacteria bacterium]|nr:hypothetical protein [Candidatus Uhrbacteria bacterium]